MSGAAEIAPESDFSVRKIKIATVVLLAQMFATMMLPLTALTLVMMPMTREFGWSATEFSLAPTAMHWSIAITSVGAGYLIDRVGVRPVVILGTVTLGGAMIGLSYQTADLWLFYLWYGFMGFFGTYAIGLTKIVAGLFTQHRGKAMAILGVESTLAGAGMPPLLNWMIQDFGWRGMFLGCGLIVLALIPVLYFTIDEPGTAGEPRTLFRRRSAPDRTAGAAPLEGLTAPQILRDGVFWMIAIATVVGTAPRSGMGPLLVPMLLEKGFAESDAVAYLSFTTLVAPLGTLASGFLLDRVQSAKIAVPFKLASFVGLALFAVVTASFGGWPLLMASVAFSGFSFGTSRPIGTYLHVRFFGLRAFGFYHGLESALVSLAMGIAPPAIALIAESAGSYSPAYAVVLVSLFLGAILFLFMGPYRFAKDIGAVPAAIAQRGKM